MAMTWDSVLLTALSILAAVAVSACAVLAIALERLP